MVSEKLSYSNITAQHGELRNERAEWEAEWQDISRLLLPGRGIYQTYTRPQKRKLTTQGVVNTSAEDNLYILAAAMHSGLTSPSRPWLKQMWKDERINQVPQLRAWLEDSTKRMLRAFGDSNFYSVMNSYYVELAGFGGGTVYVGEDTGSESKPFRFELLTVGEYDFALDAVGNRSTFYRTIFMTPAQLVERFPDTASKEMRKSVTDNKPDIHKKYVTVLEAVLKIPYQDKDFTRVYYEVAADGAGNTGTIEPLEVAGYYEFPYPGSQWNTIGSDKLGIGPGSRALPYIARLQEIEKAILMANHKGLDPPVLASSRLRGKIDSKPGGRTWNNNINEGISELYKINFDIKNALLSVERIEQALQKIFFNDLFLTASRDPNASPLKAAQVHAQEREQMFRLGPTTERTEKELLVPLVKRCFNIMKRKGMFQPLDPQMEAIAGEFNTMLIGPLAVAQRTIALGGIQSYIGNITQLSQLKQDVVDNVDIDAAAREIGDINGVELGIMRPQEMVDGIRRDRAEAMAAERQKQEQAQAIQAQSAVDLEQATASKTQAEAGQIFVEGQATAQEAGIQ